MSDNKRRSLPRIDNNYQIDLRYPDINDFLKDTSFTLLDNQTTEISRISNVQLIYSSARSAQQVMINSFVTFFKLSDVIIFAFTEDQELLYDFLIVPSLLNVQLTQFTATRSNQEALVQSVQNYANANLTDAANFNIQISASKIASLLTDALHYKLQSILAALDSVEIGDPYVYFRNNLSSLTMQLDFLYRSTSSSEYQTGFSLQVKFEYLVQVESPEPLVSSASVSVPVYNKNSNQLSILLNGKFTRSGQLSFSFLKNNLLTNSSLKLPITTNTLFTANESLGMSDYVIDAVSGLYIDQPKLTYNYFFKPDSTTVTYTGVFFSNFTHKPTTSKLNLDTSNYTCSYKAENNLYNVTIGLRVTPVSTSAGIFNQLLHESTSEPKNPVQLRYQLKLSEYVMKENLRGIELDTASGQLLIIGSVSKRTASPASQFTAFKSGSHSNTYSSTQVEADGVFFQKCSIRVGKSFVNQADYTSVSLSNIETSFQVSADRSAPLSTTNINVVDILFKWTNLTSTELAALYLMTTSKQLSFTFYDSFFNELATSAFTNIPTVVTRAESPFINPQQWVFYGQITGSSIFQPKSLIPSTALTVNGTPLDVVNQLRVISATTFDFDSISVPINESFSFNTKLICIAEYAQIVNKVETYKYSTINLPLVEGEHYSIEKFLIGGSQIRKILISSDQRKLIAKALQFTTNQKYRLSILLPFDFVRQYGVANVTKHLVRSTLSLPTNKYTYGYIWRVK